MFGRHPDEGFTDDDVMASPIYPSFDASSRKRDLFGTVNSVQDCEELAYQLLASLPRSRLAEVQRRLAPLLQFDVVGSLPDEVSLQIFSHLPYETLLVCGTVSRRWHTLSNDQTLWKKLCAAKGWAWREPPSATRRLSTLFRMNDPLVSDDEGMGDSDEEEEEEGGDEAGQAPDVLMDTTQTEEQDSGFVSLSMSFASNIGASASTSQSQLPTTPTPIPRRPTTTTKGKSKARQRHSAPSILPALVPPSLSKPNYKLLHQTHVKLHNRFLSSSYRRSTLQSRSPSPTPTNGSGGGNNNTANHHTNTIYCLQLYTYPSTGEQVLFTGSRDKTIREWSLETGMVKRVNGGVHTSSVLSLCVRDGWLASGGSDRRVALWDLREGEGREGRLVKVIRDHFDSVLCVRFDGERLVSCSKDRTVRVYAFPSLEFQTVLTAHRAAVNAVSLSPSLIVSGSGDRSVRLWDAKTGNLLRTFENHHSRGIASIDFKHPNILSGSSDKHLRVVDITTLQGWSTSSSSSSSSPAPSPAAAAAEDPQHATPQTDNGPIVVCQACGCPNTRPVPVTMPVRDERRMHAHADLVRSVALGDDFVISGSYDLSVKVWERTTGALVADLTGGHTARIFCVGGDCTKIVSCGEDQRICIWDFSHGIDTSFVEL